MKKEEEILRRLDKIESLLENRQFVPLKTNPEELITAQEALSILKRSRSWLDSRIVDADDLAENPTMPADWYFVEGLDTFFDGKNRVFKRKAIDRMKSELVHIAAGAKAPRQAERLS